MHRTRTVDYAIIMSGEDRHDAWTTKTVHLRATSSVQQATNHAWLNPGKEPCRIVFVFMDSKQRSRTAGAPCFTPRADEVIE